MESLEEMHQALEVSAKKFYDGIVDCAAHFMNLRKRHFQEKWNQNAVDVLDAYAKLVDSCCYHGEDYKAWVPFVTWTCHWVVHPDKYDLCQPTQMDQDAYYAIMGQSMSLTIVTHVERN